MTMDWKDALNALKESGAVPVDNTPEPAEETIMIKDSVQKDPLHVITDRKGRKGKTATIIEGFTGPDEKLEELAKTLKQRLGTGGSTRDSEILIQGDRKADIISILKSMGYRTKG